MNGQSPFPAAYDIPLDFNQVYSLAALFITSCPESNPALPVKAFPVLTAEVQGKSEPGGMVKLIPSDLSSIQGKGEHDFVPLWYGRCSFRDQDNYMLLSLASPPLLMVSTTLSPW